MKRVCRGRSEEQRKSEKRAAWRSALECFLLEVSASLTLSMMGLERGRRCCNARGGLLFPCCALVFAVRLVPSDKGKRGARIAVGSLRSFVVTSSSAAVEHTALGAVFSPPLSLSRFKCLSLSLSSNNNTKATNARSVCAVALVQFFSPLSPFQREGGGGFPPNAAFNLKQGRREKNAMVNECLSKKKSRKKRTCTTKEVCSKRERDR